MCFFLTILEAGSSKSEFQQVWLLFWLGLWFADSSLLAVSSRGLFSMCPNFLLS